MLLIEIIFQFRVAIMSCQLKARNLLRKIEKIFAELDEGKDEVFVLSDPMVGHFRSTRDSRAAFP